MALYFILGILTAIGVEAALLIIVAVDRMKKQK